jgi:hypothetical protein
MTDRRAPGDLFDWTAIGGYLLLVLHSIRRHRFLFLFTWLSVVGLSIAALATLPRTYEVVTKVQVQHGQVLYSGNAREADAPTKQAAQTVLRHDNLVALVNQTDMVKAWYAHRAPILKFKDAIWARFFPRPSIEDQADGFVGLLEKEMWVTTSEGTVTIGVRLKDAQLAYLLVEGALVNFFEARHAAEISSIGEEIAILQGRADEARQVLEKAIADLQAQRAARAARLGRRPRVPTTPFQSTPPDEQSSRLRGEVEIKRRAIADLEEFRRRRITELETRLQEARALYSESHPAVQDLMQSLQAVQHESPQVQTLRRELVPLESELKQRGLLAEVPLGASRARQPLTLMESELLHDDDPREGEDPEIEYAKSQVRHAIERYNGLLDRLEAARLEEDTARAAFKYRYTVLKPPQRPTHAVAPKPALILSASIVAGLFLAVLATAFLDLSSRKLLEPWQVEHRLGVPLLARVRLR